MDTDFFLVPAAISSHDGPLATGFPVENRLIPQTSADLREALTKSRSKPYQKRIADFHLLLWLLRQPNLDASDIAALCAAVQGDTPPMEGYQVIIDGLAGL